MTQSLYQLKALINKYTLAALFLIFFAEIAISAEHQTTCTLRNGVHKLDFSQLRKKITYEKSLGNVYIYCNDPNGYEITFSSLNFGKLVSNQGANNVINYIVLFSIRSNNFSHDFREGTYTYTSNTASAVSGDRLMMSVRIRLLGIPVAGEYTDIFSVSVSSND